MNENVSRILRECAEVPLDPSDAELAAIAVAIHLEETLGQTIPPDLLNHARLIPAAARERTVRQLLGGS